MSDPNDSTSSNGVPLSLKFLDFCAKVRKDDPSILPEPGEPFKIRHLSEKEGLELADALLENTNITCLELGTATFKKSFGEAMSKYVRTSKRLQRFRWKLPRYDRVVQQPQEMLCYFLPAFQESTSLKELDINFPLFSGPPNLALEDMLTHTQSLRSLSLLNPDGLLPDSSVAAVRSGLKKNTTLRELTLEFSRHATTSSPILTSLCGHPLLRRLCLRGVGVDLTGLETVLRSDSSKITELEIHYFCGSHLIGLTPVLQALARHPALAKLILRGCRLDRDDARELAMVLCNSSSLHTLVLKDLTLRITGLAELAPALCRNTSIRVLDISGNNLKSIESAEKLRDIIRSNKTMTALALSGNGFGETTGAIECIADGLGSNSTLLEFNLSSYALGDDSISTLAQTLGSPNTALQKLTLSGYSIRSTGVGALVDMMEQSHHIKDLDLSSNPIRNGGASLLARSLGSNALPNLKRLSLSNCGIGDDGFLTLISALEQNTSLLYLDLRYSHGLSERVFLALAESLPEIKTLQRINLRWCTGLDSNMPLLLAGLRKNTNLFCFHVETSSSLSVPPLTPEETSRYNGGWVQEVERLGYRNRFLPLLRAPKESLPPLGVWPRALAQVATLPDVIFKVLRSKPNLVPSTDTTEDKEAAEDTGVSKKRKRGDE
jgi:Ran GTPase-activating protein (RanGAP) involved in mRNA processing and transport